MQNNALSEKQYLSAKKKFHSTKVGRPVAPKLVMCLFLADFKLSSAHLLGWTPLARIGLEDFGPFGCLDRVVGQPVLKAPLG
jgi:hypothetical protein